MILHKKEMRNYKSKSTVTIKAGMEITAQVCYLDRDGGDLLTASMTSTRDEADWSPTRLRHDHEARC